jgi:DNA-binding NarL/FixJ family response regulator
METIHILIADDHLFYREGVKAMLQTVAEVAVVGEAGTGDEAVAQVEALQPDVVLMDLKMPGLNGIDATRRIVARHPHVAVLILTMFDDDSVFAAVRAGARGYLLKDATLEDLLRAVHAVYCGEAIFSPTVAQRMMRYFAQLAPARLPDLFPDLTEREREVLALVALGRNNEEIAAQLGLTSKTVRNYVSNVLDKLHVNDRAQAIVKAREAGLGVQGESQ